MFVIVAPVWTDLSLATDVPNIELEVILLLCSAKNTQKIALVSSGTRKCAKIFHGLMAEQILTRDLMLKPCVGMMVVMSS